MLFQHVIQPPLERRREDWMIQVGERLNSLEEAGLNLGELQDNDEFISAVLSATQIALRTHQEEKLRALRNAVINVAKGHSPEETLQQVFFNLIDSFTGLHIRILKVFQAPESPKGVMTSGLNIVLENAIPDMRGNRELYDQLWKDLHSRGLVNTDSLHGMMSASGLSSKRTTAMGDAFLNFIEES